MTLALFGVAAMSLAAGGDIDPMVRELGLPSDYRLVEAIGRHGCRAVPALVRQLEVVRTYRILGLERERYPRAQRVVWTIATLRHITGRDFYAPRPVRFDPDENGSQELTSGAPTGKVKFFGVWMSRGSHYFAPPAQQRAIIRQWRRYSESGVCRLDRPNPDFGFWLYGSRHGDPVAWLSNASMRLHPPTWSLHGRMWIGGSDREDFPEGKMRRRFSPLSSRRKVKGFRLAARSCDEAGPPRAARRWPTAGDLLGHPSFSVGREDRCRGIVLRATDADAHLHPPEAGFPAAAIDDFRRRKGSGNQRQDEREVAQSS